MRGWLELVDGGVAAAQLNTGARPAWSDEQTNCYRQQQLACRRHESPLFRPLCLLNPPCQWCVIITLAKSGRYKDGGEF